MKAIGVPGAWERFTHNRAAVSGAAVVVVLSAVALLAPWIAPSHYAEQDLARQYLSPGWPHIMGTDELGRDLFSRIVYGARVSLAVALVTTLVAATLGTLLGAISGYVTGWFDLAAMRVVDAIYSFPDLLLIILLKVILDPLEIHPLFGIVAALSLISTTSVARLIRGEVLRLKERSYVESARALGVSSRQVLWRHLLPGTLGPLMVLLSYRVPAVILAESALSFLGLGIAPPYASWGTLASDGWRALRFHPHLILFPGLAIFVTVLAFNFFGDGLRDALDPRSQVSPVRKPARA